METLEKHINDVIKNLAISFHHRDNGRHKFADLYEEKSDEAHKAAILHVRENFVPKTALEEGLPTTESELDAIIYRSLTSFCLHEYVLLKRYQYSAEDWANVHLSGLGEYERKVAEEEGIEL